MEVMELKTSQDASQVPEHISSYSLVSRYSFQGTTCNTLTFDQVIRTRSTCMKGWPIGSESLEMVWQEKRKQSHLPVALSVALFSCRNAGRAGDDCGIGRARQLGCEL